MSDFFDEDIKKLNLSEIEKNGLQLYRNYSKSFKRHAIKKFIEALDAQDYPSNRFEVFAKHLLEMHERDIAVSVCAYADDLLESAYRKFLPPDVPGGITKLVEGYGPLADLSKRLVIAYCLGWIGPLSAKNLDAFRKMRNRYAYSWDLGQNQHQRITAFSQQIDQVEEIIKEELKRRKGLSLPEKLTREQRMRARAIMCVSMLECELAVLPGAINKGFGASDVLYGSEHPKVFSTINAFAFRMALQALGSDATI